MTDTEKIEEVLEEFDFEKVHKVMVLLNWRWINDNETFTIPSYYRMMEESKRLLYHCKDSDEEYYTASTGGFKARKGKDENGENIYSLRFVVCELSNI